MLRILTGVSAIALVLLPTAILDAAEKGSPEPSLVGTYPDEQLAGIGSFTLPRTVLYDGSGELIPQEEWPVELEAVQSHAGDAYCCVSETPLPPGHEGPPPDCEKIVYGTDVLENFEGLLDPAGHPIAYDGLPPHDYLLVEYYATWCPPCVAERKALEAFFGNAAHAGDYLWVAIDVTRLPEAKEAAK